MRNDNKSCQDVFSYTLPRNFKQKQQQPQISKDVQQVQGIITEENEISIDKKIEQNQTQNNQLQDNLQKAKEQINDIVLDVKKEIIGQHYNPQQNSSITQKCVKLILFLLGALISGLLVWSLKQFT